VAMSTGSSNPSPSASLHLRAGATPIQHPTTRVPATRDEYVMGNDDQSPAHCELQQSPARRWQPVRLCCGGHPRAQRGDSQHQPLSAQHLTYQPRQPGTVPAGKRFKERLHPPAHRPSHSRNVLPHRRRGLRARRRTATPPHRPS
jgi:hypothetical protein